VKFRPFLNFIEINKTKIPRKNAINELLEPKKITKLNTINNARNIFRLLRPNNINGNIFNAVCAVILGLYNTPEYLKLTKETVGEMKNRGSNTKRNFEAKLKLLISSPFFVMCFR
tara:strand:+ start:563 stop:907 length:345 start_codon:yes stop_codon:yes gene_type:complete